MPRRTLARDATLCGIALHTGATATAVCRPAPARAGITFQRVDLGTTPVPARVHHVGATERRTALGAAGASVSTVEHLLASAMALGIDDMAVEVDGPELPIADGSFAPWVAMLAAAGIAEQAGEPWRYRVRAPFELADGRSRYRVEPADSYQLTVAVEWEHPVIGRQTGSWTVDGETFTREIAPARTFGFQREAEALRARGFALGGAVDNVIVLSDDGVVGTTLRWPDEFVRHKAGDVIGDLALVGGRIAGHVIAERPSHQGNVALARRLVRTATREGGGTVLDIGRIMEVLPHRYPFLLVDRIVELEPERRVVAIKNVTINEPFFVGHFPGHPIMPGVLIVEAMAQAGGVLVMDRVPDPASKVVYFMSLDNVKFRRPVVPGDQLRLEVEMLQNRGRTLRMRGEAYVDGQLAAEAEMMAGVVDR
ncbi:MAG TPA: UDP-3-O-acyl-N-acetylglucosamine deacetylase [Gemmatimonadales bacterium]|nr:UDP-3-O-acyl-N-acetylglucosamine deacetylase [Gemmatimonadales bacterium]